jgi:hypothetical protein
LLLSPLFYRYYCTWELHVFPRCIQVSHVHVALLTGKCSSPVGLAVGVHYVCSPQGGSQHPSFFLAGVWPVFSLGIDDLLFWVTPCDTLNRFATGASLVRMGEGGAACAILTSAWDYLVGGTIGRLRWVGAARPWW